MDINERCEAFVERHAGLWQLDACGVTRSDRQIPALLHPDAYVADTQRTRVLLVSGLSGRGEDVENAFEALRAYSEAGERLQRDVALSAIPCGNPDGLTQGITLSNGSGGNPAAGYPPEGRYYDDASDPEARYLWRWVGFNAPDVALEVREGAGMRWEASGQSIRGIASTLSAYPIADDDSLASALSDGSANRLASIPTLRLTCSREAVSDAIAALWRILAQESALGSSPARQELDRRRARTPLQMARILAGAYGHKLNPVIYTQGVALSGRLRLAELDAEYDSPVDDIERMVRGYAASDMRGVFGESDGGPNLAGLVWADELADASGDGRYNELLVRIADEGYRPATEGGIPPASDDDYRVEDMFFGGAMLGRAQGITGDRAYSDIQARFLLDAEVQQADGLFWHCRDAAWFWGRGNGFAALGYAETLSYMPDDHADREALLAQHRRHLIALLRYQQPSGMWRQVVDFPGSYQEMTATCMIGYAMARGIRRGWLDADFGDALELAWQGVNERIDGEGGLVDVCTGTGIQSSLRDYLDRPAVFGWDERGGAMALWFACEMERYRRHRDGQAQQG